MSKYGCAEIMASVASALLFQNGEVAVTKEIGRTGKGQLKEFST